jgi:hypothetical protein
MWIAPPTRTINNESLESRMLGNVHVRFGKGWMEKVLPPVDRLCCSKRTNKRTPAQAKNLASHLLHAFSGSDGAVVLKKKHTSRLDLAQVVPPAIESYLQKAGAFRIDIERMQDFALADDRAKAVIYEAFTRRDAVLPVRLLPQVHRFYFDDEEQRAKFEDRSLWSLSNAFTGAVKALREVPQQRDGVQIGRYFGRVLHPGSGGSQVAIPADIEPAVAPVEPEFLLD